MNKMNYGMKSTLIDMMWHEMIVDTLSYTFICAKLDAEAGNIVYHIPGTNETSQSDQKNYEKMLKDYIIFYKTVPDNRFWPYIVKDDKNSLDENKYTKIKQKVITKVLQRINIKNDKSNTQDDTNQNNTMNAIIPFALITPYLLKTNDGMEQEQSNNNNTTSSSSSNCGGGISCSSCSSTSNGKNSYIDKPGKYQYKKTGKQESVSKP